MSSNRNLAADELQIKLTNFISIISTLVNFFGFFIILKHKSRENATMKFMRLFCHFTVYVHMVYFGSVLSIVVLFPLPGVYCIGWLRNWSGVSAFAALNVFYYLFLAITEAMIMTFVLKLKEVARDDSKFKPSTRFQIGVFLFIHFFASVPQFAVCLHGYSSKSEIEEFVATAYPSMTFIFRYPCVWMIVSKYHWMLFAMIFGCTLILFCVCFVLFSLLVLYEIERQAMSGSMSNANKRMHRQVVDDVVLHVSELQNPETNSRLQVKVMIPFLLAIPVSVYLQFFVEDGDDVSIPVALALCIFVSTPIPTMVSFLCSNEEHRNEVLTLFRRKPQSNQPIRPEISATLV